MGELERALAFRKLLDAIDGKVRIRMSARDAALLKVMIQHAEAELLRRQLRDESSQLPSPQLSVPLVVDLDLQDNAIVVDTVSGSKTLRWDMAAPLKEQVLDDE